MKITKNIEAEILQVMDDYWGSYLKGDLQTWASFLPEDYRNIGTTKAEIWNSKKEIVDFTEKVVDQTVGMAETRNKKTQIILYDPYLMVHELGDLYVKAEEGWVFYAPFRLSSLLEKTADGWKILHQHGSYPDAKADDGEAFAFDEIKAENKKLRDAIQSRTIELEHKNRELEIEAALERVRAQTMAMHSSEDVGKCILKMFGELTALGGSETIRCGIGIFNHDNENMELWTASKDERGEVNMSTGNLDRATHPLLQSARNAWKDKKDTNLYILEGEDILVYYKTINAAPGYSAKINIDKLPGRIFHYDFVFDQGILYAFSHQVLPDELTSIFQRFSSLFGQTYRRYLDLVKAEAQAREAKIEAALERVRARTMAMHSSVELLETGAVLFKELSKLDVTIFNCGYVLMDDKAKMGWNYGVNPGDGTIRPLPTGIPQTGTKVMDAITASWRKQEPSLIIELDPQETIGHQTYVAENCLNFSLTKEQLLALTPERLVIHTFNFKHGYLLLVDGAKLASDQQEMLMRFANVFEMTYRRFLDLKKAEAQAREAKIEAALEKVRSRSLAVNRTDEFNEVVGVVFEKLGELHIPVSSVCIAVFEDGTKDWDVFGTGAGEDGLATVNFKLPYFKTPFMDDLIVARNKADEGYFSKVYSEEDKNNYYEYTLKNTALKNLPDDIKQLIWESKTYALSVAYTKNSSIMVNEFDGHVLDDNQADIIKRFTRVFEQAYIRFMDLQKAEAQAREAQIEAALERVRASTMAMHKSEDLKIVVGVLYDQIASLNIPNDVCFISTNLYNQSEMTIWLAVPGEIYPHPQKVKIPVIANPIFDRLQKAINKGKDFFVDFIQKKDKDDFYQHVFSSIDFGKIIPVERKQVVFAALGINISTSIAQHSTLGLWNFRNYIYNEDENEIIKKMHKVFEQTYTRFLDLQKAETQAREAQIEAALERTRSQSMMMQHSDELNTTSNVFHEQLLLLGLPSEFSYVWLPDEAKGTHMFWATWSENLPTDKAGNSGPVTSRSKAFTYPLDKTEPYTAACFEMWESDEDVFVKRILPEEVEGFFSTWSELVGEAEQLKAKNFPDGLYYAEAYMKYGCFGINIRRPLDNAEQEVLRRVANEFERTYTRFLDLKKAEEQAHKIKLVNQENERLLHSILPQPIAEQIRTGQQNVVKRFEQVSILFADIVGFTVLSEKLKPGEVVDILNGLFSKFDDLTDKYGLEKIKTIGDAYMVAAGVPEENADHAMTIFRFAQDMLLSLGEYNEGNDNQMKIRIGISSGPVVAGVIGKKKFAYDLWGDSVNTAARMEANGQAGKIQVAPTSYELLKNDFSFEKIPNVMIKGKGAMDVYLWKGK